MVEPTPQILIRRTFEAPRALLYQAFTDPGHLAMWWGPIGNSLPRDDIEFDIRPGGFQRWTEIAPGDPHTRIRVHVDLTDVSDGVALEGVMRVSGERSDGFGPFETRFRFEFFDEPHGRSRLEIRQWLPPHLVGPSSEGWGEAFTKLDAALLTASRQSSPTKESPWHN